MPAKKRAEPAEEKPASATCANCGQPAVWRTAIAGAVERVFCDEHGERAYPGLAELAKIESDEA